MAIATLALPVTGAPAQLSLPPILNPPPPPPRPIPPVGDDLTRDPPDGDVRGTVVLVHAGGWAGHDVNAQQILFSIPGDVFSARKWRVVSIDYQEGQAGLGDVLNTVGDELSRRAGSGPMCVYGESAGGHLSMVAATRLRSIDCVIALGAPLDLPLYESDAKTSANVQVQLIGSRMSTFFGTTPDVYGPWNPLGLAASMRADVLLLNEGDDAYVPLAHSERFKAARPTTQTAVLEAGDPADPSTKFVHGTISAAGRGVYASLIGAFADRIVAAHAAERDAKAKGCARVDRTLVDISAAKVQSALICLARGDRAARRSFGGWRSTSIRLRGEINAARIWALLRTTTRGKEALAALASRRAKLTIAVSDRSRITLRRSR